MNLTILDIINLSATIASLILAVIAIWLALYFYRRSKDAEQQSSNALAAIQAQTDTLQNLSKSWLTRLVRYATEPRQSAIEEHFPNILALLQQIPQSITTSLTQIRVGAPNEDLLRELVSCYIALYFYCAQTNFWSQFYLPDAAEFDENNEFHSTIMRMVDMSAADFTHMANVLGQADRYRIESSPLHNLLIEARDRWRDSVRTCNQVFTSRARGA